MWHLLLTTWGLWEKHVVRLCWQSHLCLFFYCKISLVKTITEPLPGQGTFNSCLCRSQQFSNQFSTNPWCRWAAGHLALAHNTAGGRCSFKITLDTSQSDVTDSQIGNPYPFRLLPFKLWVLTSSLNLQAKVNLQFKNSFSSSILVALLVFRTDLYTITYTGQG